MRNTTSEQSYPTAVVSIDLDGHHYEKEVAVSEQLREDALLGVDISLWPHLIKSLNSEEMAQVKTLVQQQEEISYAVTTRAQMRQKITRQTMTASTAPTEVREGTEAEDNKSTVPDTPAEIEDCNIWLVCRSLQQSKG